jgi:hypothetical protein
VSASQFMGQQSSSSSNTEINSTNQLKQRKCSVSGCGSTDHDKRNCPIIKNNQNRPITEPNIVKAKKVAKRKSSNAAETINDDSDNEDMQERTEVQEDNYNPDDSAHFDGAANDYDSDAPDDNDVLRSTNYAYAWKKVDVIDLTIDDDEDAPPLEPLDRPGVDQLPEDLTGRNPGPVIPLDASYTPHGFFELFFTIGILYRFVEETNKFAAAKGRRNWRPLSIPELKTFFAIVLFLGIIVFPSRALIWDSQYGSQWVMQMMRSNRFEDILACLHWTNTIGISQRERDAKSKENCYWSIQGFLDGMAERCLALFNPGQKLDVDESCFSFLGRFRARCFNPNKPDPYHLKAFCLNDAITGFCCNFFMYQGKDEVRPEGLSATEYPVIRLTDPHKFQNKNHVMATDNWYTSILLALRLFKRLIYLIGTIKAIRQGVPKEIVIKKKGAKMPRGFLQMMSTDVTVDGRLCTLTFSAWMDNKPVHMLSTIPTTTATKVQRVGKTAGGEYLGLVWIGIPTVIVYYNWTMGGTDRWDQMIKYYKTNVRTKRWQTRVIFHFTNGMMVNAHILWKLVNNLKRGDDGFTLLSYMRSVIDGWATPQIPVQESVGAYMQSRVYAPGCHNPIILKESTTNLEEYKAAVDLADGEEAQVLMKKTKVCHRRTCKWGECHVKVNTKCEQCNVHLCLGDGSNNESCWSKFHHSLVDF